MGRTHAAVLLLIAVLGTGSPPVSQEVVETAHANGAVHERYALDAEGRRHGAYEEFDERGATLVRAAYRRGERHGKCTEFDGNVAERRRETTYRKGLVHGKVRVFLGRKVVSKQKWRDGQLVERDGIDVFSRGADELRDALASIDRAEPPLEAGVAARREAALCRLMAYRYLCGVPHEGMSLVPEWNELCTAAAELSRAHGKLSHTPERPEGFPEDRYQQGYLGAGSSNLSGGDGMVRSVDGYMDDSDASNIDRVGHRRWCIDPVLKKTGFGEADGWSAMWAFDQSGKRPRGLEAVMYPPPGYVPVDYFGPRHAWSIAMLKGGGPKLDELRIEIRELDAWYCPADDPLPLDFVGMGKEGQGTGPCLIFRPAGLRVAAGSGYLAAIYEDGSRKPLYEYVVEFCAAARASE